LRLRARTTGVAAAAITNIFRMTRSLRYKTDILRETLGRIGRVHGTARSERTLRRPSAIAIVRSGGFELPKVALRRRPGSDI